MSSEDSDSNIEVSPPEDDMEDQPVDYSSESIKDHLYIYHKGKPSHEQSKFAQCDMNPNWPHNLWSEGQLIYDVYKPENCLPPPINSTDQILRFESHFESGNLARAYYLGESQYHCVLEYDRNPSGSCQWFYFRIRNARKERYYKFFISGFHKNKGLYSSGCKIFWYSEKRAINEGISWTRGGDHYAYSTVAGQKKKGKKRSTMSFNMTFPYNDDDIFLCYALPYTYSDLIRDIGCWIKTATPDVLKSEVLCETVGGRECPVLTATKPNDKKDKPYIFITARIHPGESNSSFLMRGFMNFLLRDNLKAKEILENYIVKVIPMLNIDGVIEGFYRVSLSGNDLNRMWQTPDSILHPVITKTKSLFAEISASNKVAVYFDFHGHSRLHGTFAFGCPNDGTEIADTEKILPRIISQICDAFSWNNCVFSFPEDRKSAGRIVVRTEMDVIQSFTIETSFGGIISGPRAGFLYDEVIWEELGSACCEAVFHFLRGDEDPMVKHVRREIALLNPPRKKLGIGSDDFVTVHSEATETEEQIFSGTYCANECKHFLSVSTDSISTCQPGSVHNEWISSK